MRKPNGQKFCKLLLRMSIILIGGIYVYRKSRFGCNQAKEEVGQETAL